MTKGQPGELTRFQKIKERLLGGPSWEESVWAYRLANWRCTLFGHKLYEEDEYEDVYYVATWTFCERCDYAGAVGNWRDRDSA